MTAKADHQRIKAAHRAAIAQEQADALTALGVPCAVRSGWVVILDVDGLLARMWIECAVRLALGRVQLCNAHYIRWRRTGDAQADRPVRGGTYTYFQAHVMEPSDGCRSWPFDCDRGYGKMWNPNTRRQERVHVQTAILWHGERPFPNAQVAHSCGVPNCWAGEHLRWATARENHSDQELHGTRVRGERHPQSKLTDDAVRRIRRQPETPAKALAQVFGVSVRTIEDARSGKLWAHVTDYPTTQWPSEGGQG